MPAVSLRDVLLAILDRSKNEVSPLWNSIENWYNLGENDESPLKKIKLKISTKGNCESRHSWKK